MNKKVSIIIAVICVLVMAVMIVVVCQEEEQPVNNTKNTTNTVSIRDQIMATQNYLTQNTVITGENTTSLEDLEKYNKEEDVNYEICKDSEGVSFMYPKGWLALGTEESPAFMSTEGKGATVNIAKDTMSEDTTVVTDFDAYMAFQKIYLVQQMTMLSDIEEKQVNLNGKKAYILNYITESEENSTTLQLNVTQVAFVDDNNKVYILTMAVLNNYYDEFKATFEKMAKSFMID